MDLASLGQVFLIWMLLSLTLEDCATSKSKVRNVLSNLDGSIIRFNVFPMLLVGVLRGDIHHIFGGKNLDNTHIGSLWKPMYGIPHLK